MLFSRLSKPAFTLIKPSISLVTRHFTSQNVVKAAQMPPRLVLNEEDLEEAYLKGSGPGGQKIVCRHFYGSPLLRFLTTDISPPY